MKHRTSQHLYAYWNELRAGRAAPRRFEIEPSRIAPFLPETFILEQTAPDCYVFRLAGTRICEQFGVELRGANFLDMWHEDERSTSAHHLDEIATYGGVGCLLFNAVNAQGRAATFETIILPLIHTRAKPDRFLGSIGTLDSPIWLGSERLVSQHVLKWSILWPDGKPRSPAEPATPPSPLVAELANARRVKIERRLFRVVDGGLAGSNDDHLPAARWLRSTERP
jgi:hypothetical protein